MRPRAWVTALIAIAGSFGPQTGSRAGDSPSAYAIPSTEVRRLHSMTNDVDYELYISLPRGYDPESAERHPVIYLLDAAYSFPIAHAVVWHLGDRQHLPPVILVAIAYSGPLQYRLHRTRDYTPTFHLTGGYGNEFQHVSGGGPRFLEFIEDELIPYVEETYRVNGNRTLVGHSYGGLFAVWSGLTEPALFDRILAVSPSLWYDDYLVLRLEERNRKADARLPSRIYLTVGDREVNELRDMVADLRAFARRLEDRSGRQMQLRWEVLEGETHNSVFPGGFSRGLRWLFEDQGAR
ncbi:MAG: alpha/beta hydrolase [Gammaproteobacteria bacterium]